MSVWYSNGDYVEHTNTHANTCMYEDTLTRVRQASIQGQPRITNTTLQLRARAIAINRLIGWVREGYFCVCVCVIVVVLLARVIRIGFHTNIYTHTRENKVTNETMHDGRTTITLWSWSSTLTDSTEYAQRRCLGFHSPMGSVDCFEYNYLFRSCEETLLRYFVQLFHGHISRRHWHTKHKHTHQK